MGLIRLLLAISVVIAHSSSLFGINLIGGQLAVEVFFIISGFYMALILAEKYNKKEKQKFFFSNRLLKIFPLYWFVLFLSFIYEIINLYSHSNPQDISSFFNKDINLNFFSFIIFLLSNLLIFGQDILLFLGININSGNLFFTSNFHLHSPPLYSFVLIPQAWTLALELTFYLLAPFITKFKSKSLILLMILSLLLKPILYNQGLNHDPWTFRFFPAEFFYFIAGIIAYRIYKIIQPINIPNKLLFPVYGTYLSFLIFYQFLPDNKIKTLILFSLTIFLLPLIFRLTKSFKIDSYIGELSYPIYISHFLIINTITHFTNINHHYLGILASMISIVFSVLLLQFIIKPIDRIRQKRIYNSNV